MPEPSTHSVLHQHRYTPYTSTGHTVSVNSTMTLDSTALNTSTADTNAIHYKSYNNNNAQLFGVNSISVNTSVVTQQNVICTTSASAHVVHTAATAQTTTTSAYTTLTPVKTHQGYVALCATRDHIAQEASDYSRQVMGAHTTVQTIPLQEQCNSYKHKNVIEWLSTTQPHAAESVIEINSSNDEQSVAGDDDCVESVCSFAQATVSTGDTQSKDTVNLNERDATDAELARLLEITNNSRATSHMEGVLASLHNVISLLEIRHKQMRQSLDAAINAGHYQEFDYNEKIALPTIIRMHHFIEEKMTNDYHCGSAQCRACFIMSIYKQTDDKTSGSALLDRLALALSASDTICDNIFACLFLRASHLQQYKLTVAHDKLLHALSKQMLDMNTLYTEIRTFRTAIYVWKSIPISIRNNQKVLPSSIIIRAPMEAIENIPKLHAKHMAVLHRHKYTFRRIVSHFLAVKLGEQYKIDSIWPELQAPTRVRKKQTIPLYSVSAEEQKMKLEIHRRVTQVNSIRTSLLKKDNVAEVLLQRLPLMGYYLLISSDELMDMIIHHRKVAPCKLFCNAAGRCDIAADSVRNMVVLGAAENNQNVLKSLDPLMNSTTKFYKSRTQNTNVTHDSSADELKVKLVRSMYQHLEYMNLFRYNRTIFARLRQILQECTTQTQRNTNISAAVSDLYQNLSDQLVDHCQFKQVQSKDARVYNGTITCNDLFANAIVMNAAEEAMAQTYYIMDSVAYTVCNIFGGSNIKYM